MKSLLDALLPRIVPGMPFLCVPHEGKQDLERSVPRKIRAWREPGVRFVILRDQNGGDCRHIKRRLVDLCVRAGCANALVRVVCRELEAWYLGELDALADAYENNRIRGIGRKARFRNPDAVTRPATVVSRIAPGFQKISGARLLGARLTRRGNRSRSFRALIEGLDRIVRETSAPHSGGGEHTG